MLLIRREQMEAFQKAALTRFECQMVAHLQEFAPTHCEALTNSGVLEVVRLGINRASKYGLTHRGPVRLHIELMFLMGSYFDIDPQLQWVAAALNDPKTLNQDDRANCLYDAALEYSDRVSAIGHQYSIAALRRLRGATTNDFLAEGGEWRTPAAVREIYPQKFDYLGSGGTKSLVRRSIDLANSLHVTHESGVALFSALMFFLGQGFINDPQYPWITTALYDSQILDPNDRTDRLQARVITYLCRTLDHLGARNHV